MDGEVSSISRFYEGRSILITGATGFMGKVLVEKLLRSCPGIERMYIMVRPKRGKTIEERLEEMTSHELFQTLKEASENALSKIVPIKGDMTEAGLGLSENDRKALRESVSVVFHNAASIRLNQDLRTAFRQIVTGTKELLDLSKSINNLEAFVYVSTAYSNCENIVVEERHYPMSHSYDNVKRCLDFLSDECVKTMTPFLLQGKQNAYLYAKAFAEHLVAEHCNVLPVAIFRPSLVVASHHEPVKGWIDNLSGPTGLIMGCCMGFMYTVIGDNTLKADLVPVDMTINCLIAVSWKVHVDRLKSQECMFYNYADCEDNRIIWRDVSAIAYYHGMQNPSKNIIWFPREPFYETTEWMYWTWAIPFQVIPAHILDFLSQILGKEKRMVKIQNKIQDTMRLFKFFTLNELDFKNNNVVSLRDSLNVTDQESFNFDLRQIEWNSYFESFMKGVIKYTLKETEQDTQEAKKWLERMYWLDVTIKLFLASVTCFAFLELWDILF